MAASWIKPLRATLAGAEAFRGCALRHATRNDEDMLFDLHRGAMREYVDLTWGWDEAWQRGFFADSYVPGRNAVILRDAKTLVGRICLTRHWRRIFLRDIELVVAERNRGLGTAIVGAVLELARPRRQSVELMVLKCNPAQRLYARLGFVGVADDGSRITMRA